jgi:isopentenyl phosphate kinase
MSNSAFTLDDESVAQFASMLQNEDSMRDGVVVHGAQSFHGIHRAQSFHDTDI